jgi:predicted phage terminase large subunit-like protein
MTTTLPESDFREHAARGFEKRPRAWARPGDLARALDPGIRDTPALELIDAELVKLADHAVPADALAVFMPVQEGKSQKVSRRFPEWLLAANPALRIAIVSYEKELATRWGRQILRDIRHDPARLPIGVMPDSSAAGRWDTPEGGGIYCTGIGGPLAGQPADVLIIDDPHKGRAEAESPVYRDAAWDWWENVAIERLAPGGIVVLVATRWHTDDLPGRILSRPGPLRWRVLSMPAIAGDRDVLGRTPGEEFPSARGRAPGYFTRLAASMTPYVFQSVYQQTPVAAAGNFFRRAAFRYWTADAGLDPAPMLAHPGAPAWIRVEGAPADLADCYRFATVDLAASVKTSADWTVIAVWAITRDGSLILLDRARGRVEMADHFTMARPLRARWRFDTLFVPREFWGKTLTEDARAAGVPVAEVVTDTDKVTRAIPAAARLHAGKVAWPAPDMPGCRWVSDEWEPELLAFDRGEFDDQVDTFSAAARVAAAHWLPPPPARRPGKDQRSPDYREIDRAYAAATGNGHHPGQAPPDLMTLPLG